MDGFNEGSYSQDDYPDQMDIIREYRPELLEVCIIVEEATAIFESERGIDLDILEIEENLVEGLVNKLNEHLASVSVRIDIVKVGEEEVEQDSDAGSDSEVFKVELTFIDDEFPDAQVAVDIGFGATPSEALSDAMEFFIDEEDRIRIFSSEDLLIRLENVLDEIDKIYTGIEEGNKRQEKRKADNNLNNINQRLKKIGFILKIAEREERDGTLSFEAYFSPTFLEDQEGDDFSTRIAFHKSTFAEALSDAVLFLKDEVAYWKLNKDDYIYEEQEESVGVSQERLKKFKSLLKDVLVPLQQETGANKHEASGIEPLAEDFSNFPKNRVANVVCEFGRYFFRHGFNFQFSKIEDSFSIIVIDNISGHVIVNVDGKTSLEVLQEFVKAIEDL